MALIKCPECGKEVSDLAASCPNCGCPLSHSSSHTPSVGGKKILPALVVVSVIVIFALFSIRSQEQAKRTEYISNLNSLSSEMLSGAADAETACNLVRSVWYNAIFEKSSSLTNKYTRTSPSGAYYDFDHAIKNLYKDEDFSSQLGDIRYSQSKASDLMASLSSPPKGLENAYSVASDTYDVYYKLTSLALSPTGSLESYTDSFSSYDSDFLSLHNSLNAAIPSE